MTTYSISLDDVDLALLPLRTHKYNDFLKKQHYHFQIINTEEVEELHPTIYYKCHICATDVPAAFAREHTSSVKHRANARIASVAAQRTHALISAPPPPLATQDGRYCANCSTIVGRNHEKTKEHRVAVMHDKLLWELMSAYVGDDRDSEDGLLSDDDFTVEEVQSRHNGHATFNENNFRKKEKMEQTGLTVKTNKNEADGKKDKDEKPNKSLDIKEISTEVTNDETKKLEASKTSEVVDFENGNHESSKNSDVANVETKNYELDEVAFESKTKTSSETVNEIATNNSCTDKEIPVKNDQELATTSNTSSPKSNPDKIEYVEFVTKENKVVKVFSDYYHSFSRKNDTIHCRVCNTIFDSAETDSHMFSLKHLNKMPTSIIDEHCVRKVDGDVSHCILCNSLIKNTNLNKHCQTLGHSEKEKQLMTENPSQATTSKITQPTHQATTSKPAKPIEATKPVHTVTKTSESSIEVKSDWPVIYPFEVTKQGVRCVICDCLVPNDPENRKGHLLGLNHVRKVKNKREAQTGPIKLEYPFEATKDASIARCTVCDMKVTTSAANFIEHLKGVNHVAKLRSPVVKLEYPFEATNNAHVVRCAICDVKVSISPTHMKKHVKELSHTTNEMDKKALRVKLEYPYEATKNASVARCIVCNMKVTITSVGLIGHLHGQKHVKNVNNKTKVKNAFEATKHAKTARCVICDTKVPSALRNLLDHVFGSSHIKKEASRRGTQQQTAQKPQQAVDWTFDSTSDTIPSTTRRSHNLYNSWV